ncbi:hypothetical protein DERF_005022 [Dermatophagoides farinae]|uniref:Peptidase A2 domain-containing protein n=1 Tax=Dermatophagoides farinae TaxID=6954 RepID=A0A922I350_DERFA|nr:hypothetical protein DERF_005022 [Dermatophagoides farinae]
MLLHVDSVSSGSELNCFLIRDKSQQDQKQRTNLRNKVTKKHGEAGLNLLDRNETTKAKIINLIKDLNTVETELLEVDFDEEKFESYNRKCQFLINYFSVTTTTTTMTSTTTSNMERTIKYQRRALPTFDVDEKFFALKSMLKGEPLRLVANLLETEVIEEIIRPTILSKWYSPEAARHGSTCSGLIDFFVQDVKIHIRNRDLLTTNQVNQVSIRPSCIFCRQNHKPIYCNADMTNKDRKDIAVKKKLCFVCLQSNHQSEMWKTSFIGYLYRQRHQICRKRCCSDHSKKRAWRPNGLIYFNCLVNNKPIRAFIDTGAEITCISKNLFDQLKLQIIKNSIINIRQLDNLTQSLGRVKINLQIGRITRFVEAHVPTLRSQP